MGIDRSQRQKYFKGKCELGLHHGLSSGWERSKPKILWARYIVWRTSGTLRSRCSYEPVSFDSTFALFLCESDTNNHCCLARRQVINYMRVQRLGPLDFANP